MKSKNLHGAGQNGYPVQSTVKVCVISLLLPLLLSCYLPFVTETTETSELFDMPVNAVKVIGPDGGTLDHPRGMKLIISEGALEKETSITIMTTNSQNIEQELYEGILFVGNLFAVDSGETPLNGMAELRFTLEIPPVKDPSLYSVYTRSSSGGAWTDAGGFVEGNQIILWTSHLSMFVPVETNNIHRPIGFINDGPYHAVVTVSGHGADPNYTVDPRLFPYPSTVSFAPSAPAWPNPSRFLSLPLGSYYFCYYWSDGKDEDKDGKADLYHVSTKDPYELMVDSPSDLDLAPNLNIRTDVSSAEKGDCGSFERPDSIMPPLPPHKTPTTRIEARKPGTTLTSTRRIAVPPTLTPAVTKKIKPLTPTVTKIITPTGKIVDGRALRDKFISKADEIARKCTSQNCSPPPGYSGCALDCANIGSFFRSGVIYNDYFLGIHPDYLPRADAVAEYMLENLKACNDAFVNNRTNSRYDELHTCVTKFHDTASKMLEAAWDQTCAVYCSEQGKKGSAEGVPRTCACTEE